MPDLIRAKDASGRPLHPMLPSSGRLPPVSFWLLDNGEVRLDIFVRCGANAGKYFIEHQQMEGAVAFLRDYYAIWEAAGSEAAVALLEEFFHWEWTGGTPTLDGEKTKTSTLTLEDLGL